MTGWRGSALDLGLGAWVSVRLGRHGLVAWVRWVYGVGRRSGSAAWFDGVGQRCGSVMLSFKWIDDGES